MESDSQISDSQDGSLSQASDISLSDLESVPFSLNNLCCSKKCCLIFGVKFALAHRNKFANEKFDQRVARIQQLHSSQKDSCYFVDHQPVCQKCWFLYHGLVHLLCSKLFLGIPKNLYFKLRKLPSSVSISAAYMPSSKWTMAGI